MRWLLLCLFLTISLTGLRAQAVANLNPKVRILGGEAFYVHDVLAGQSIEAIAKAYVSTPESIRLNNPALVQLEPGMKLRIPYSDASAAVMSKFDLKLDDALIDQVYEAPDNNQLPSQEPTQPIEEAVKLLMDSEKEELSEEEQQELERLNDLSEALRSSMSSLKNAEDKVKSKPVMDDDGLPKRERNNRLPEDQSIAANGMLLAELLEQEVQPMIDEKRFGDTSILLKEFFLVRINQYGIITNVRDERTEMNANTFKLSPDSLKGFQLISDPSALENQFQSIGLVAEVRFDTISVRFKQNRVKFLEDGVSDEDAERIALHQKEKQLWGKYDVVIANANYFLATYEQVEFNPFGQIRSKIYFNSEKRVSKAIVK